MSGVRKLDDRLLPAAAGRLRQVVDRAQVLLDRLPHAQPIDEQVDGATAPAVPVTQRLRGLDDRYARTGLLGFVAEVPQLAVVLVTLLLAISAFTVAARESAPGDTRANNAGQPDRVEAGADPSLAFVGIQPGAAVGPYIADANRRLDALSVTPDASLIGLMVFSRYVTPAQAADLAAPTRPTRAYYAPRGTGVSPGETAYASVVDIRVDLPAQLKAAAGQLMERVKQNESFAKAIPGNTAEERAQKAEQLRDAATWRAEAKALLGSCACVFAVVVRGPARVLAELARRPGVRLIDPAPPGSQTGLLEFRPLRPETTAVEPTAGPNAP